MIRRQFAVLVLLFALVAPYAALAHSNRPTNSPRSIQTIQSQRFAMKV